MSDRLRRHMAVVNAELARLQDWKPITDARWREPAPQPKPEPTSEQTNPPEDAAAG